MHTDQLLDSCLQAISSGQEIPPDIARYLARHPEQRAEVEELILIAQRASRLPPAALSPARRGKMQKRLAAYMGVNQALLAAQPGASELSGGQDGSACRTSASTQTKRWRLLATAHLHLPACATLSPRLLTPMRKHRTHPQSLPRPHTRRHPPLYRGPWRRLSLLSPALPPLGAGIRRAGRYPARLQATGKADEYVLTKLSVVGCQLSVDGRTTTASRPPSN